MRGLFRRCATTIVAFVVVLPQFGGSADALNSRRSAITVAEARPRGRITFTPPARIDVKEPRRVKPTGSFPKTLPTVVRAVVPAARELAGFHGVPPHMLSARETARLLVAARRSIQRAPAQRAVSVPPSRSDLVRGGRRAQGLQQNGGPFNTTGITPWWAYRQEAIPGGGRLLVNMGLGNLIVQANDMTVPHKGVDLVFKRTYNSQSGHNMAGSDGAPPSMYGNGWTSSLDAHIVGSVSGNISVYDIDGARYDYQFGDGTIWVPTTPGQHATLTYDGGCGMLWTGKSGVSYYFWVPSAPAASSGCPSWWWPNFAAYAGRLYQVIGRNRNTYVTLSYGWDSTAAAGGKINAISAQTESGLTASLTFRDVNGHRLLQSLTFPDGRTAVQYGYDANGNLVSVTLPPNNSPANGTPVNPVQTYGYQALGSDYVLQFAASPRWNSGCGSAAGCYSDGGGFLIGYGGSSAATSTVSSIQDGAIVNPVVSDGNGSTAIQGAAYATNVYIYQTEYYTTANWNDYVLNGRWQSTYRDTAGHMSNWIVDGNGRPTQTQVCTASTGQGTQCPSTAWLTTNQTWDANNNLTAVVSPRGAETDAAYDANGNVVAIAQPPQYNGYARPTTLVDYDGFNNVTATCDPALVHSAAHDWAGQYAAGADNYCSSQFTSGHPSVQLAYPTVEPFGRPVSVTSAGGYVRTLSYDPSSQGGADYGLATKLTGTSITQFDQSTRVPTTSLVYDASGNVVCVQSDAGTGSPATPSTQVMTYDGLNRLVSRADPDDASLTGSCTGKIGGVPGSTIVNTRTYYPDGSLATTQSASESALGYGTVYTYDLDGNQTTVAPYNSNPQSPQTPTMKRWFDGMDRLVETQEPADPATAGDIPISMRYAYDLSQSGSAATLSGVTVTAHGNLFGTQKNTPTGWIDFTYAAYDSADRKTTDYAFAPCPAQTGVQAPTGPIYCNQSAYATRYDWDTSALPSVAAPGLLVATLDAAGESREITYDGLNNVDSVNYGGDGGVTTPVSYAYDFDGRLTTSWDTHASSLPVPPSNQVNYSYTADGMLSQAQNVALNATTGYSYYPDTTLAGVSGTAGSVVNQPNLYRYSYRNDGLIRTETFGAASQSVSFAYTPGGRMTSMTDFSGTPSITAQYADGHGRLSSYTTPAGTYGSIVYDSQGRMLQYTDPYNAVDGETVSSTYNVRGDLVIRTFTGGQNPAINKPGFNYPNFQGVPRQNPTDQWDGRTGAPLISGSWTGGFTYDVMGRLKSGAGLLSYDAENRLVGGDTWNYTTAPDMDCPSGGVQSPPADNPRAVERSYAYDAQGQVLQDKYLNGTRTNYRQWFWNGSDPLYTLAMNSNGTINSVLGYGANGLGSIQGGGLTIADPDFDGAIAQYHNSSGHSSWAASNAYNQYCRSVNPLPPSANYGGPTNDIPPSDGSSDGSLIVQSSGRTFLSTAVGYTTPDYSSATPYSARRPLNAAGTGCPPGEEPVFDNTSGRIGCVKSKPNNDFNVLHEMLPGGDPFGFKWPHPHIAKCLPVSAIAVDYEFPLPIVLWGARPFSAGPNLTLTNTGRVWASPSLSAGFNPGGWSVAFLTAHPQPGQTVNDIASGTSFGASVIFPAPSILPFLPSPLPGFGYVFSANDSGWMGGPAIGQKAAAFTTSYGLFYHDTGLKKPLCPPT